MLSGDRGCAGASRVPGLLQDEVTMQELTGLPGGRRLDVLTGVRNDLRRTEGVVEVHARIEELVAQQQEAA